MNSAPSSLLPPLALCLYRSRPGAPAAALPDGLPEHLPAHRAAHDAALATAAAQARAALHAASRTRPESSWLLIDLDAALPAGWWPRLQAAIAVAPQAVISPLCSNRAALDPRPAACDPSMRWDDWLWLCADPALLPCATWSTQLSYWPVGAAEALDHDAELPVGVSALALPRLFVGDAGPAPSAIELDVTLAALRQRLGGFSAAAPARAAARPVRLHLIHGWGGGVERFARDLAAGDPHTLQLILRAESDPQRRQTGRALALHVDLDQPPIGYWPLNLPITGSALNHADYQAVLAQVCARYAVSEVMVSSMIGHSLDALDTGLPTTWVCHDYFPLWPLLHADFGDAAADFSGSAIPAALAASAALPFDERRPAWWQALRRVWVERVRKRQVQLVAPSQGVRDNYLRIEPALRQQPWTLIPHGLEALPRRDFQPDPQRQRWLVLGRINGGKGEDLLAELIPQLPPNVELALLGAGAAGMRFFGCRGVHVVMDYRRDQLPTLIAELRPQGALLLSTVAETFSYTLSELQSLGVPVIATRRGSFIERIEDGVDGWLVEPRADAILSLLAELGSGQRARLLPRFDAERSTLPAMATRYRALHAARGERGTAVAVSDPASRQRDAAELARAEAQDSLAALRMKQQHSEEMAAERGEWARSEARLAEQRLQWAVQLNTQLQQTQQDWQATENQRVKLEQQLDAVQTSAAALRAELAEQQAARQQTEETLQTTRGELEARLADLGEKQRWIEALIRQRDEFERERNAILGSSSWKLTAPLRVSRRWIGRVTARGRFQLGRLLSLQARGLRSIKLRGLGGTLRRLRQEFDPPREALAQPLQMPEAQPQRSIEGIVLPCPAQPRASVIVPIYNHIEHTLTCLRSLAEQGAALDFEVIVVDDGCSDASPELLPRIPGLRYQRNPKNLGFIGACNAGAAAARGEFVVFLNNDTAVQPDWLDALINTFAQHADVGLVGAKLVYPDGRLQEAGGIVFSDASGWNYGRFDDPAAPQYNFVREVDYCSGAAIALRKSLFDRFGGFDAHYAPAYYEDTDLAMKVRQAGLRVLYQPASVVVHFEGISSGTDLSSGTKRFQVVNQVKFLERWKEALSAHPAPGSEIVLARQHRQARQVLVIDATTPQPDQDSGSVRLVNLLRLLRDEGCAVTFFADNRAWVERYTADLQQLGIEVLWHPFLSDPVGWIEREAQRFDCIIVSRHYILGPYLDLLRQHAPKARLVFDTVDLHYLREQRAAELADRDDLRRTAEQTRQKELDLIRRVDVTLVVSPVEQELLAREAPGARVDVLSNVHEVVGCRRGYAERAGLLFVGGFQHPPNIDAVEWFVAEVFPRVRAAEPEIEFHIIGSKAPPGLAAVGEQPGVRFHGYQPDIEPWLDGCRLALAPLRYGAGVKGKVNMSMAYGQPVVATPIAVEGMYLQPGEDVLVGADPAAFAAEVLRAYRDPALWQQLSVRGLANVERHFSFAAAQRSVQQLLAG